MIYIIKQYDLHRTHSQYNCMCCGNLVFVDFEDLGGFVLETDLGRKMYLENGKWYAEINVEFAKRKELI